MADHPPLDPEIVKARKRSKAIKAAKDAFVNTATGVGTSRSRLTYGSYQRNGRLTDEIIQILYDENDLAAKIVDQPVEWAYTEPTLYREGPDSDVEKDKEDAAKLKKAVRRLLTDWKGHDRFLRGACGAQAYGGGGLILGGAGGGGLADPLPEDASVEWVLDFDRRDMHQVAWASDGTPVLFNYHNPAAKGGSAEAAGPWTIHRSRILFFPGARTLAQESAQQLDGWDWSALQKVYNTLFSYDQAWTSVDAMFNDASQSIFKLSGLLKALAESSGDTTEAAKTRLEMMDILRSSTKSIVLEAGTPDGTYPEEDFKVVERMTIGQIDKPLVQFAIRLAAAADRPLTVLLGVSPQGQNATGEGDMTLWLNRVGKWRDKHIAPHYETILNMVARAEDIPGHWCARWSPVVEPKTLDVATEERMRVESAAMLVDRGVLFAEEVAMSMSDLAPSMHLQIDIDSRKELLQNAIEEAKDPTETLGTEEEMQKGMEPLPRAGERKTPTSAAGRQTQGAG